MWQTAAEYHADCDDVVEIETGSKIPIWPIFQYAHLLEKVSMRYKLKPRQHN